jgi:hypothetical protein
MATDNPKRIQRLQAGADVGAMNLPATERAPTPSAKVPLAAVKLQDAKDAPPTNTCQQTLTLTFFFDGTGNNLDADVNTWEHSNVARLYRSHLEDDEAKGLYKFYLPGIGTLFKDREVNDPDGTTFGRGFGAQGQARLDFAFARLHEKVQQAEARAENPTNKICWIKVAVFGFSRGATTARAFCRDLERRCDQDAGSSSGWRLKQGRHPIEITFLGVFDTVASAGLPPSANNLSRNRFAKAAGWLTNPVGSATTALLSTPELKRLAFGQPGADPAPGLADDHADWANGMQIGPMVKRCVHMMASHENRNSFPLDSTLYEVAPNSRTFAFPSTVSEVFYPGVHSDVGGGYRPGEGGCRPERGAQLSLIPLRAMHAEAVGHVPSRPLAAIRDAAEREDFALDPEGAKHFAHMLDLFETYRERAASASVPGANLKNGFGTQLNGHMRLHYAWRFRAIRLNTQAEKAKQSTPREQLITEQEKKFASDRAALDKELKQAQHDLYQAHNRAEVSRIHMDNAQLSHQRYGLPIDPQLVQRQEASRRDVEQKQVAYDRVRARVSTAANDSKLADAMDKYGRMLFEDAKQIVEWQREDPKLTLRPHYSALVAAYLDEFERGQGLRETADAKVIELNRTGFRGGQLA